MWHDSSYHFIYVYIARNFYAPWFSWTENDLSNLGGDIGETPIWAAHGIASILFNCGLTIVGILGVVFACGLKNTQRMPSGRLGALLFILDMCALCCVGIFPLTTGVPHGSHRCLSSYWLPSPSGF